MLRVISQGRQNDKCDLPKLLKRYVYSIKIVEA